MDSIQVNIELGVTVGTRFPNIEEFEKHFDYVCKQKFVQFYKKDARTIESAKKKVVTRFLNPDLKYYAIHWSCIHGGRPFKHRGNGIRKVHTLRKENLCPAHVHLLISDSGNDFIVTKVCNIHNHVVSEQLFKQLPHYRRFPNDVKAYTRKLLKMKTDKYMVKTKLESKLNRSVSLKEIRNFQQVDKKSQNNLKVVSEKIQTLFNSDCHLLIDENDVFKGLFFSSKEMINTLASYPEIIFIDTTYNLLAIKAPIYTISNVDGNGESNIVGVGVLMSEERENLQWYFDTFKDSHPSAANNIINIMTDNDIAKREVLRECFPLASLHICVLHVLQTFRQEITCERFNLPSITKDIILEFLKSLVYSKSKKQFDEIFQKIEKKSYRVANYLNENWIGIQEEWCPYIGSKVKNFLNVNRLEGLNAKLKVLIEKSCSLENFIENLAFIQKSWESEKNARTSNLLNKRPTNSYKFDEFQCKYSQLLTPYAFNKLKTEFSFGSVDFSVDKSIEFYNIKEKGVLLQTTDVSCSCYFSNSMGLPCKHIFAVRSHLDEELFDCGLVLDRWKMLYFIEQNSFLHKQELTVKTPSFLEKPDFGVDVSSNDKFKTSPTSKEKYRKTFVKAKLLASLASEVCGIDYNNINKTLDVIISSLHNGNYKIFGDILNKINTGNNKATHSKSFCEENDFEKNCLEITQNLVSQNNCDNYSNSDGDELYGIDEKFKDRIPHNQNITTINSKNCSEDVKRTNLTLNNNSDFTEGLMYLETSGHDVHEVVIDDSNSEPNIDCINNCTIHPNFNEDVQTFSTEENSKLLKIAIPIYKKRPTSSDNISVIGFKNQKKKKLEVLSFEEKNSKEKTDIILRWILPENYVLVSSKQIQITDLLPINQIDLRILEVNINVLKEFFEKKNWETFKNIQSRIKESASWICVICQVAISDMESSVRCEGCLHWLHYKCAKSDALVPFEAFICTKCTSY